MQRAENRIATEVIGAAIDVHRTVGPGLLESAYQQCLVRELSARRLSFETEVPLALTYKGELIECAYRADLLVENSVLVELKSVETLSPVHRSQLLTYLRLARRKLGLLLNFNAQTMKQGIVRVVNEL